MRSFRGRLGVVLVALVLAFVGQATAAPQPVAAVCLTCFATLTADLSGNGTGRVTSDDGYIDCRRDGGTTDGTCQHTYAIPTGPITVQLTAHPDTNSFYCNRVELPRTCDSAGQPDTGAYSFDANKTVGLAFVLVLRSVGVGIGGPAEGSVVSAEAGINCPSSCVGSVAYGTQLTLTASAMPGWVFAGWVGSCAGQGAECSVIATDPVGTTAYFSLATPTPPTPVPPTARPTATPRPTATSKATPRPSTETGGAQPTAQASSTPRPSDAVLPSLTPIVGGAPGATDSGVPWLVVALLLVVLLIGTAAGWLVARQNRKRSS